MFYSVPCWFLSSHVFVFYPTYFVAWEGGRKLENASYLEVGTSCELYELFSLQEAIDKLARQRTSLIIAHRLSTIVR